MGVFETELEPVLVVVFFFNDMPPEKVPDRLKGIFDRSGFSTGADAQIMPRSISTAAAIQRG